MLSRTADGRWSIGSALTSLGSGSSDTLIDAATPIMNALMQRTGESVQLYRLTGTSRTCIASKEPPSGLQNTVPVGSRMPLTAGSSAHVFMAYAPPTLRDSILADAAFTPATLQRVRSTGYAESVSEREPGLASLSAPVLTTPETSSPYSPYPAPPNDSAPTLVHAGRLSLSTPRKILGPRYK